MKIMRRVGQTGKSTSVGGSTAPSSSAPSKATSETGADGSGEDGTESSAAATPAKERQALTREEREAKYQEARERIFRDFPESKASDSPNSADQSADVSRSNSRTGRKKHRQRMPHDDTFEARSQFSAYYAGVQYPNTQMPFGGMVHEGPFASQNNYMVGHPNPAGMNFAHNTQTTGMYPPQTHANGFPQYPMALPPQSNWQNGHVPMPQFTNYQQGSQLPVMTQQQTTRSSPAMSSYSLPNGMQYPQSPPLWSQTPYQPNYPSSASQRNSQPVHWPNVPPNAMASTPVSYAYGQVQNQAYPQTSLNNSPQPVPGSYVRSNFNPQSRSFAPGGLSQQRFSETIAASQPSTTYSGVNSMWAGQENASRFLSKNHVNIKPPTSSAMGQCSSSPGRQMDNQNSIAKWGTPSHLPPKPPPSEIPYDFDRVARPSTVPSQTYSHNTANASRPGTSKSGPLVVGGSAHSNSHPHGASATAL